MQKEVKTTRHKQVRKDYAKPRETPSCGLYKRNIRLLRRAWEGRVIEQEMDTELCQLKRVQSVVRLASAQVDPRAKAKAPLHSRAVNASNPMHSSTAGTPLGHLHEDRGHRAEAASGLVNSIELCCRLYTSM